MGWGMVYGPNFTIHSVLRQLLYEGPAQRTAAEMLRLLIADINQLLLG